MSALGTTGRPPARVPYSRANASRRVRRAQGTRVSLAVTASGSEGAQTAPFANGAGRVGVPTTRHVIVLCHDVSAPTAAGLFSVSNLLQGRVDVWCRCVTAGLYLSDGLRRDTVVSLVLSPPDSWASGSGRNPSRERAIRVVQIRGDEIEGLAPAETRVALLIQRATQHASLEALNELGKPAVIETEDEKRRDLSSSSASTKSPRNAARRRAGWLERRPGSRGAVPGITVTDHESTRACFDWLFRESGTSQTVFMDADAEKTFAETFESFGGNQTTTLVLGDASGVADSELDELKRRRVASVALGPKVLLASHCIVLAHAAMDRASHASCVDAERRTDGPTDRRTDGNRQPAA